jgi:hypothetical protein
MSPEVPSFLYGHQFQVVHQVDPEQEVLVVVDENTSRKNMFISSRDYRTPRLKSESTPLSLRTLKKIVMRCSLKMFFIVRYTIN